VALALTASGCGMSVPFLHGHGAAPASAPPRASRPERAPHDAKPHVAKVRKQKPPRPGKDTTREPKMPRDPMGEARARMAAAPADPYWPYRLGELCLATDSTAAAEAALRQSLARDNTYAPALALLSKIDYDTGRHDDAIQMLEAARTAMRRGSGDLAPELLAGLALHYDAVGQPAPARAALAAIPRAAHKTTDAAAAAVGLHGAAPDSAGELAQAAVRDNPNSAACQNNYGIARLRAGDPNAARRAFMKAVDLDPRLPGPYYNLAILEKFYVLDDAAAARWFARYRTLSAEDPDGLAGVLGNPPPKDMAEGGKP
jgi:tetratricopeptide (TPR) repeat protein